MRVCAPRQMQQHGLSKAYRWTRHGFRAATIIWGTGRNSSPGRCLESGHG
jgi:hypothetical protein